MKKKWIIGLIFAVLLVTMMACGSSAQEPIPEEKTESLSEYVIAVQRKVDKALESNPTYSDLKKVKEAYDELLSSEQAQIKNYDKIEEMLELTDVEIAVIYGIQELKKYLVIPSSLDVKDILVVAFGSNYLVEMDFTSENKAGGSVENLYYVWMENAVKDESTGRWSCELSNLYKGYLIDDQNSGYLGKMNELSEAWYNTREFMKEHINLEVEVDLEKVMANVDYRFVN